MPPLPSQFQISLVQPNRLQIEIRARIDGTDGLVAAAVDALAEHRTVRQVLIDIRNVDDCTPNGRVGLGTLQKLLARRQLRAAWLVGTGRMNGLARLVGSGAADPNVATFVSLQQAEAWFGGTAGRVDQLFSKVVKRA